MEAKHTPGPWAVVAAADDFDNISVCAFDGDPRDGIMSDVVAEIMSIEDEADARLIAAAPDLLEALKHFVASAEHEHSIPLDKRADEGWIVDTLGHDLGGSYLNARAAISKAEGTSL